MAETVGGVSSRKLPSLAGVLPAQQLQQPQVPPPDLWLVLTSGCKVVKTARINSIFWYASPAAAAPQQRHLQH